MSHLRERWSPYVTAPFVRQVLNTFAFDCCVSWVGPQWRQGLYDISERDMVRLQIEALAR